jgi:hypothetical protein
VNSFLAGARGRVHYAAVIDAQTRRMRSPRPSSLLAGPLVVQPYGFWHRPWVRAGALAIGLALGVLGAAWLFAPDADGQRAERAALKAELEAARRALDAERLRAAELRREAEIVAREAQRLREELAASQKSAAKRRERRPEDEAVARAPATPPPTAAAPPPPTASASAEQ